MNQPHRRWRRRYGRLFLAASMTLITAIPAYAEGGTPETAPMMESVGQPANSPAIGRVNLDADQYFELERVMMHPESDEQIVVFSVHARNGGTSDLLFKDYWVRVATKDGSRIPVYLLPQDKQKNRIAAKSSQTFTFYAAVPSGIRPSDLIFDFIKWDFSQPDFERQIGRLYVPADYAMSAPVGGKRSIPTSGSVIEGEVTALRMTANESHYKPVVELNVRNVGERSVQMPDERYLLRTGDGYMYPLEMKAARDEAIDPLTDRELQLTGDIPVDASTEGWQLIVLRYEQELGRYLPAASFELPHVSEPETAETGQEYAFTNDDGTYYARMNALQRLPWKNEDLVTADLTLSNRGAQSLPLPELTGYFLLDDTVRVEAEAVRTDQVIGLPAGASTSYRFIGRMPYTYAFESIKLVLQEKEFEANGAGESAVQPEANGAAGQATDLLEFEHRSGPDGFPSYLPGQGYRIEGVGRSAEYRVHGVHTYSGETADTVSVQLEAANLEQRFASIPKLVAYLQMPDGTVYPAAVADIPNTVGPGGQALLYVNASVPKGLRTDGMSVIIGEAVSGNRLTPPDGQPDAYINPGALRLPRESEEVKPNLLDIDLAPYTLSIRHISTHLDVQGVTISFDYELKKSMPHETNTSGRKLVLEVTDESNKIAFSREYDFRAFEEAAGEPQGASQAGDNGKETFKLGAYENFKLKEEDPDLMYMVETLKNYRLNIYDSFDGKKKLLASKQIRWFEVTD